VTGPHRIVFLGTPSFAVPSLDALVKAGLRPALVVTQPPKGRGRGRRVTPTPVAETADRLGLPVRIWDRGDREEVTARILEIEPDFLVLAAFGRILKSDLLDASRLAPVNLHPSLLPRYRGVAPVQAALLAGDSITGCTTIRMVEEVDAGEVFLQRAVEIDCRENAGELTARLAVAGAALVVETLRRWDEIVPVPQGGAAGPPAAKIGSEDGRIDWDRPVERVHDHVRAMNPRPGAFTSREGSRLLVRRAFPVDVLPRREPPGTLAALPGLGPCVVCSPGLLRLERIQAENRGAVEGEAYLRGAPVRPGERLGSTE
jgi:methionyl-tRNA formyltransferase